jgi:protein TonB
MKRLPLILIFILFILDLKAQKTPLSQSSKNNLVIRDPIPVEPSFPGGDKAFGKFLAKNVKWPKTDDGDTMGKVIISFIVEKDGRLTGFSVVRSLGKDFDAEALRVIKKSPKWIPATRNAKPVRVKYYVPIHFTLSE